MFLFLYCNNDKYQFSLSFRVPWQKSSSACLLFALRYFAVLLQNFGASQRCNFCICQSWNQICGRTAVVTSSRRASSYWGRPLLRHLQGCILASLRCRPLELLPGRRRIFAIGRQPRWSIRDFYRCVVINTESAQRQHHRPSLLWRSHLERLPLP